MKRVILGFLIMAGPAFASGEIDVTITHGAVWQTQNPGDQTEGFFDIHNTGAGPDVLTGWTCPDAQGTELVDGTGKVLSELTIPPGETVSMSGKGPHFILRNTQFQVQFGSLVPCSLTFQNAGDIGGFLNAVPAP